MKKSIPLFHFEYGGPNMLRSNKKHDLSQTLEIGY